MMKKAIDHLKGHGIDSFDDGSGILVIPCSSPEEIYDLAGIIRRYLKEIGYEKSWRIDPYYYQKKQSIEYDMFNKKGDNRYEGYKE